MLPSRHLLFQTYVGLRYCAEVRPSSVQCHVKVDETYLSTLLWEHSDRSAEATVNTSRKAYGKESVDNLGW